MSDNYDVFTYNEVTDTLKELKRETASEIDKICHITAIMNNRWGRNILDSVKQCLITLLPKKMIS